MKGYVLAEYASARDVLAAAQAAARGGHPPADALLPNPVEGIDEHLAPPRRGAPIGWVMFVAGALGALAGYGLQWYSAVLDYPIDSGGRPLNSWPAFLLVPYETAILSAAVIGVLGWMRLCGLPRPHHPLFEAPIAGRAVQDRYLLVFPWSENLAQWIDARLEPLSVHEVRE